MDNLHSFQSKRFLPSLMVRLSSLLILLLSFSLASAWACPPAVPAPQMESSNRLQPSDKDHYRRNSLCLILLTHSDKQYAEAMERVFLNQLVLPNRYNEHNISSVRVIKVKGKQDRKKINQLLVNYDIAHKIVERWFKPNSYLDYMDMGLVHDRGGYGAFYDDYQRALMDIKGTAMLQDEGIELLNSTFVLVCDMDYIDKKKGAGWAAFGMALLSAAAEGVAYANAQSAYTQYAQGNYAEANRLYNNAQTWHAGAQVGTAASAIVADIGGFRVKMHAYLYKLEWTQEDTERMFNRYWIDRDTPSGEVEIRKKAFARECYTLRYIGDYSAASGKTILRSWSNEDQVILDVTQRSLDKGIEKLAKNFVVFRPRAPFHFYNERMYSHIGTKEDVKYGKKYEILQPYKDKKGIIQYKKIGECKAIDVWQNHNIRFDNYFDTGHPGSQFAYKGKSDKYSLTGLQLREI